MEALKFYEMREAWHSPLLMPLYFSATCRNCKDSDLYEPCWTSSVPLHCWLHPLGTLNCDSCICLILSHCQFIAGECLVSEVQNSQLSYILFSENFIPDFPSSLGP